MISPLDLVKRLGVGGRLVPFFKCVCVYFAAQGDAGGAPSAAAAAAKCAPVLCLLLLVALHDAARGPYARCVCAGLALSALGDALLLWPQHLVAGMAAFGAAHVAYVSAFGWGPRAAAAGAALYGATALFVCGVAPPPPLRAPVAAYGALLATMAWRGAARGGRARAGAMLFLASDAALALRLFGAATLPLHHVLVMLTYYLAQLAIALSALDAGEARCGAKQ